MSRMTSTVEEGTSGLLWAARLSIGVIILVTIIWIVLGAFAWLEEMPQAPLFDDTIFLVLWITNSIVGFLIVSRYPRHIVGWSLLADGLFLSLQGISGRIIYVSSQSLVSPAAPLVDLFAWMSLWLWLPTAIIPFFFIPLYFPNGRLLSRRWRFVAVLAGFALIAGMVLLALQPGRVDEGGFLVENPYDFAVDAALSEFLISAFLAVPLAVIAPGAFASVILRYRRSKGLQRAQMKWVVFAIVLLLGAYIGMRLLLAFVPGAEWLSETEISGMLGTVANLIIPLAIGVAILRHQLMDIDVIIRKTLIYGVVTVALATVYFGSVVLLQQLFAGVSGEQSPVAIVISTLLIAALFSPLRRRAQAFIDRRFYRAKYDMAQTLAGFAQVARNETDLEALTAELQSVVRTAMQPERVGVWLRMRREADPERGRDRE